MAQAVTIALVAHAAFQAQLVGHLPGIGDVGRQHAGVGLALGAVGAVDHHAVLGDAADNRTVGVIAEQVDAARVLAHFKQIALVARIVGTRVIGAIQAQRDVVGVAAPVEAAVQAQIVGDGIGAHIHRTVLALDHQPVGAGRIEAAAIVGVHVAQPRQARKRCACGRTAAVRIGGGILRRVAGIQRVEGHVQAIDHRLVGQAPAVVEGQVQVRAQMVEFHVAAIGEIARLALRLAIGIAGNERGVLQLRRAQGAGEAVDQRVQRPRSVARVIQRDRHVERVLVVQMLGGEGDLAVVQRVREVHAELAALIGGKAHIPVTIVAAHEAAGGQVPVLRQLARPVAIEPIQAGIAHGGAHCAFGRVAALAGDEVDDGCGVGGEDRRGPAAHGLHRFDHQIRAH